MELGGQGVKEGMGITVPGIGPIAASLKGRTADHLGERRQSQAWATTRCKRQLHTDSFALGHSTIRALPPEHSGASRGLLPECSALKGRSF